MIQVDFELNILKKHEYPSLNIHITEKTCENPKILPISSIRIIISVNSL